MPHFSLVTFNCLGSPTSPTGGTRLRALARELNERDFTVACIQEVQSHGYRRLLVKAATDYPHNIHGSLLHAPRGGLLTLARPEIHKWDFALFDSRIISNPLSAMDWLLHKGILSAHLFFEGMPIVVFNTHLNANYSGDWSQRDHRTRPGWEQLQQLAKLVVAQPPEVLVIACGDFNIPRGSWLYEEFLAQSGMIDPLANDLRPTYRRTPILPARYGVALDMALIRPPATTPISATSDLCFTERLPLMGRMHGYLSDHVGIELKLSW